MSGHGTSEVDRRTSDLQRLLASSQYRIDFLQKETAFYRAHIALMREALVTARSTIEELQERQRGRARLGTAISCVLSARHLKKVFSFATSWFRHSNHVSRADLEKLLLRAAQTKRRGIEGVVIEFHAGPSTNWRVCGIASGRVDAELAKIAVLEAAANLAAYVLVTDVDDQTETAKGGISIGDRPASKRAKATAPPI